MGTSMCITMGTYVSGTIGECRDRECEAAWSGLVRECQERIMGIDMSLI